MIERNEIPNRDEVLFAFHQTCDRPTEHQITEWTKRYPQFAEDIRAHAAVRTEWASEAEEHVEPDETMLARGRSQALNLLHSVRQESAARQNNTSEVAWPQAVAAAGFDIPRLARCINIDRMVLQELNAGRMRLPLGRRLVEALTDALNVPASWLDQAVSSLLAGPRRLGHAKADAPPTIHTRSYEEVIRASPMSEEDQRYWLGEG